MVDQQQSEKQKVIFSGIQPSGVFTLGNYLGAIVNWTRLQHEYRCYYCAVDLHAMTVRQDPKAFRQRTLESVAMLLACGLDPELNTIYVQSHVSAHCELAWILNCYTYMGELGRMTQFKEKSQKHSENINVGLFAYPVLMAADILLYQADLVPVGADQKQHLEITRDIALRFNAAYGNVFTVPKPYIPKAGARIMSLQEPESKMSKSDENPNAFISLTDPAEVIVKKFRRAVTDSEGSVRFSADKPGVSNLMNIYCAATGSSIADMETQFEGKGYKELKEAVAEAVIGILRPIQSEYARLTADKTYLESVMQANAERAARVAAKTLQKVQKKIGLIPKS
ncbi:MAG: tryptophan--tRNA ligase [Bacillota bacterium]